MSLAPVILESLRQHPGKVLCRDADTELTAEQVLKACRSAAGQYQAVVAGPRVSVLLPTCAWCPSAVVGAIWAGKVPVLLNPTLKPAELEFILQEAGIDTVVIARQTEAAITGRAVKAVQVGDLVQCRAAAEPLPAPAAPNDAAVLLYTSGTTGRPKGVPLTHHNLLSNARGVISRLGAYPDDVFLAMLPLFHAFGLTGTVLLPLLLGAEVTYARFSPERIASLVDQRRVKVFIGVPTMYRLLVRSKVSAGSMQGLRLAVSGGDALPSSVRDAYRQRFDRELLEGYGLTETSPVISVNTPEENRPGTVGRTLPDVQVRIQGEDGTLQPAGKEGEVEVRGPNVMPGYFNRPEENRSAFTPDGWFRTGDLGCLGAEGYLTIAGRIKEVIVRGGEKIMPREVEDVLERHPKVLDAAVVGEPDGERGDAVVAYVAPAEQAPTAEELRAFCRGWLADFKVPRRFVIAPDLPRGPTGKILKRALRDLGSVKGETGS
jgi:long-chain acyl-CoA synthetase